MTIMGGSILGFAVHTNMSMYGKAFSYLQLSFTIGNQQVKMEARKGRGGEKRSPLREPVFEGVAIDGVPSNELSDEPVQTEPQFS